VLTLPLTLPLTENRGFSPRFIYERARLRALSSKYEFDFNLNLILKILMILTLIKGAYCMNLFTTHRKRTLLTAAVAAVGVIGAVLVINCSDNGTKPGKEPTPGTGTGTDSGTTPGTEPPTEPGEIKTVTIGGKTWMAENLNIQTENSWCYLDIDAYCNKYGSLYNWNEAKTVCPSGWHLPTDQEWADLVAVAGGASADSRLKTESDWQYNGINSGGINDLGFSAKPGGARLSSGRYTGSSIEGYWWTATEAGGGFAYYRIISCQKGGVERNDENTARGHSVRCVKD
jgi:uncharacterized protein (TIGR02145 family)